MAFIYFQLFLIFIVGLSLLTLIKNKGISVLIAIVFAVILMAQITSLSLGGSLIDYKYYLHLRVVDLQLIKYYPVHTQNTIIGFIISFLVLYFVSRKLNKINFKNRTIYFSVISVISISLMFLPNGIAQNIMEITSVLKAKEIEFDEALKNFKINPQEYIKPNEVIAQKGKNIIIISIESLEKGYLIDSSFKNVTPYLRSLSTKWSFYDMPMLSGSNWTAGSLYTLLTGFPCFFNNDGNEMLKSARQTHLTGLSHVLKSAGYNMSYILGNPNFAGMGDILRTYEIGFKAEKDFDSDYPQHAWGLYDQDLFKEAKKELDILNSEQKPFALFLSTINTHGPEGIPDNRLTTKLPKQRNNLELMACGVDVEIKNLIKKVEELNLIENTAIYIFPDHLLMGTEAPVLKYFSDPRSLYLLTNVESSNTSYNINDKLYQIDLPKIILEGAQVKHNAKFLTDYLPEREHLPDFILNNRTQLTEFNNAAIKRIKELAKEK
ncbi:MAG: sulfatase-like hydrolase/transferase [Flavobacteriales bacterium]|nr:sulfatase-like hydrolase/transferase [Flavobacteriales bacterium]MCB9363345.1 sulfatase-like hydrolase/transferase [Flavobacteriales bacterium]